MGYFVANTRLLPSTELRKDWQRARVLCPGGNGCGTSIACWEPDPQVLDVARPKAHPCASRAAAVLVFLTWGDEILRPRGHRQ